MQRKKYVLGKLNPYTLKAKLKRIAFAYTLVSAIWLIIDLILFRNDVVPVFHLWIIAGINLLGLTTWIASYLLDDPNSTLSKTHVGKGSIVDNRK